jgi:multiple sugar transport system substrate-binding protein
MRRKAIVFVVAFAMAPLGAHAADLVVWWDEGYYAEEDEAVREIIAAFEQETGKQVELTFHPDTEFAGNLVPAVEAGRPPDFAFGTLIDAYYSEWALTDRLIDLTDTIGSFSDLFDPDALAWWTLRNDHTGQDALYALPMGQFRQYAHVWKSLSEQAAFTLEDIPGEWEAFWAFWCDQVPPAVRQALGRDNIWGVGLSISADNPDIGNQFDQFTAAYDADYVTRDGRLVIDDPDVRRRNIKAIDSFTGIYRKGCTPPDSVTWGPSDNNKAFHAHAVVMVPNNTLSIVNALKRERPDDYYKNTATVEWPLSPSGVAFPIRGGVFAAVVFKAGGHVATAKEFVRFLVAEGWLAHYLNFSGERILPPMPKLLDSPFWLDPSDPHRMAAAMQASSRPMQHDYATASGNWRHDRVWQERVWPNAIHRVVTEGISPEQAVDEAIARIKQILSE